MRGVTYGSVCKNCGENIIKRTDAQGWIHGNHDRQCRPTYAEPSTRT